jgi:hypothetical protein
MRLRRLLAVGLIALLAAVSPAGSTRRPAWRFAAPRVIPFVMFSESTLLIDTNHDGHPDLVAQTPAPHQSTVVLFGDGKGHFEQRGASFVGAPHVSAGDVNGDGNVDLAGPDGGESCPGVLLGDGAGGFPSPARLPRCALTWPTAYIPPALGDITGDGNVDLLWYADEFFMDLAGNGHGGFERVPATPIVGGFQTTDNLNQIIIEDVNHDGRGDLVGAGPEGLTVALSNGDGSFGSPTVYTFPRQPNGWGHGPAVDVVAADLNHDGYPDFLVALAGAEPPDPPGLGRIAILFGSPSGVLTRGGLYSAGRVYWPSSIALADFNRDGKVDLVVADTVSRGFSRLLGLGGGRFGRPLLVRNRRYPVALRALAGDVTGNRLPDVVLSTGQQLHTFFYVFAGRKH